MEGTRCGRLAGGRGGSGSLMCRGYGREVRAKWIAFRDEKQLAEYEKDDLQEAF